MEQNGIDCVFKKSITFDSLLSVMKYCVIIPAYNSHKHIASVVADVLKYCSDVIIVDDGSTDRTLDAVRSFAEVDIISYHPNRGKGYALSKGFEYAVDKGFTHAVTLDADGQHKAKDLSLIHI